MDRESLPKIFIFLVHFLFVIARKLINQTLYTLRQKICAIIRRFQKSKPEIFSFIRLVARVTEVKTLSDFRKFFVIYHNFSILQYIYKNFLITLHKTLANGKKKQNQLELSSFKTKRARAISKKLFVMTLLQTCNACNCKICHPPTIGNKPLRPERVKEYCYHYKESSIY